MVDGAGDDIARRQLGALVKTVHKALAVGQQQFAAFTAYRFGNQERFGLRVVQAGGVELVEFHIGHPAAGTPGHGNAIAGGTVGVAGVQIHLAGTTGGQYHGVGADDIHFAGIVIQKIRADTAMSAQSEFFPGDQVDGDVILHQGQIGFFFGPCQQGIGNRMAGGVSGVNNASRTVAAFAGQVEMIGAVLGKGDAQINQPLNRGGGVFYGKAHSGFVAQAGSGNQRVLHVSFHTVVFVQHRGDTALRPTG